MVGEAQNGAINPASGKSGNKKKIICCCRQEIVKSVSFYCRQLTRNAMLTLTILAKVEDQKVQVSAQANRRVGVRGQRSEQKGQETGSQRLQAASPNSLPTL